MRRLIPARGWIGGAMILGATLMGSSIPAAAGTPGSPAAVLPAPVPPPQAHAVAVFKSPTIKGVGALLTTDLGSGDGSLRIAIQGVSPSARYALVIARQACGVPFDKAAGFMKIEQIDGESARSSFTATVPRTGLLPFIEQSNVLSFRLRRTTAPRGQVACANATLYGDPDKPIVAAGPYFKYELKNVLVSSFKRGIVLVKPTAGEFRLTGELNGLRQGTHRIVGDDASCGSPVDGLPPLSFSWGVSNAGTWFRSGARSTAQGDVLGLASVRLFKGASGFSKPEGCSNIIAILIGL